MGHDDVDHSRARHAVSHAGGTRRGEAGGAGDELVGHVGADGQVLLRVDGDAVADIRLGVGAVHDHVHRAAQGGAAVRGHAGAAGDGHQVELGRAGHIGATAGGQLRVVAQDVVGVDLADDDVDRAADGRAGVGGLAAAAVLLV